MNRSGNLRILATLVATAVPRGMALAGNDDGVLLGNAAILSGGALVASVKDGSALWYNPAGLAAAGPTTSFDLSGSAYMLRHHSASNLLVAQGTDVENARFLEIVVIPSVLAFVRPLTDSVTAEHRASGDRRELDHGPVQRHGLRLFSNTTCLSRAAARRARGTRRHERGSHRYSASSIEMSASWKFTRRTRRDSESHPKRG